MTRTLAHHKDVARSTVGASRKRDRRSKNTRSKANEAPVDLLGATTELDELLLNIASETMSVRSNGALKKTSIIELVVRKLVEAVLKEDSSHARGQLLRYFSVAEQRRERDIELEIDKVQYWKALQQQKLSAAEAGDGDPRLVLPHPDDIVINSNGEWTVEGPMDHAELVAAEKAARVSDVWLIQSFLDDRLDWPGAPEPDYGLSPKSEGGSAMTIHFLMEEDLPERLRMTETERSNLSWTLCCATKRQLLKEAHQSWRSIGEKKPRGWRSLPKNVFREMLMLIPEFVTRTMPIVKAEDDRAFGATILEFVEQLNSLAMRGREPVKSR